MLAAFQCSKSKEEEKPGAEATDCVNGGKERRGERRGERRRESGGGCGGWDEGQGVTAEGAKILEQWC